MSARQSGGATAPQGADAPIVIDGVTSDDVIECTLSTGAVINLRPATSKGGNALWALLRNVRGRFVWDAGVAKYGLTYDAGVFGGDLPTWVEVAGVKVSLEADQKLSEKSGKLVTRRTGKREAIVNGRPMKFAVRFSKSGDPINASVGFFGKSEGGGFATQSLT